MSTTRLEIELLCHYAKKKGCEVEFFEDKEGRLESVSLKGYGVIRSYGRNVPLISLAEALRPILGKDARAPVRNIEDGHAVLQWNIAQLEVYSGEKSMLTQRMYNNQFPDGAKLITRRRDYHLDEDFLASRRPFDAVSEAKTDRYWKVEDGRVIEFAGIDDFLAHIAPKDICHNNLGL